MFRSFLSKAIIFWFFFSAGFQATGQNFLFETFRGNGRFPSNELHGIIEDNAGNKWVASDAGLIKITGNNVKVFKRKDGLASDVALKIYRDHLNRIWTSAPDGSISLIENGRIISLPCNSQIQSFSESANGVLKLITGTDSCLYGIFHQGDMSIFKISKDLKNIKTIDASEQDAYLPVIFPTFNASQIRRAGFIEDLRKSDTALWNSKIFSNASILKCLLASSCMYISPDNMLYLSFRKRILQFNNFKLQHIYDIPADALSITEIKNQMLVSLVNNGISYLEKGNILPVVNKASQSSITSFLYDKEGNFWATSIDNGLYVCRNTSLLTGYEKDVSVIRVLPLKDSFGILLSDMRLLSFTGKELPTQWNSSSMLNDIAFSTNQTLYMSLNGLYENRNGVVKLIEKKYFSGHLQLSPDSIVCWGSRNIFLHTNKGAVRRVLMPDRIFGMARYNDNVLLAGGLSTGLWKIMLGDSIQTKNILITGRINCIVTITPNSIAVGTNENGIWLIDSSGKIKHKYHSLPGRIQSLLYHAPYLYAGTKEGIYLINPLTHTVTGLNNSNLLSADEVNSMLIHENDLVIAGPKTVIKIPLQEIHQHKSLLRIGVGDIMVNNNRYTAPQLSELPYQFNSFSVEINNYSYRSAPNTQYYFTVRNKDEIVFEDTSISPVGKFSLEPGNYMLEMIARDDMLHVVSNKISIPIVIDKPVYKKWWFILLLFTSLVILFALITTISIRRIKKRELQKRNLVLKMADLEAKALQGQMNPHFIFNAVNSVQDFILSRRTDEAHMFLSTFAKLIRMVLEHNRKKNVSIDEEISLIRLYVSIEEHRLNDKISLQIDFENEIDTDNILIPSMLLQPLIENAIWHGLKKNTGEKIIAIRFTANNDLLHISIRDNGQGLHDAQRIHQSVGLDIVKERIRLSFQKDPTFEFFSLQNRSDGPGVAVQIILPLLTEY